MAIHSQSTDAEVHTSIRWLFANSTARNATTFSDLTAFDLYKNAIDLDTGHVTILTDIGSGSSSPVWTTIGSGASLPFRLGTATTSDALADSLLAASLTTQKVLVLQRKAGQSAHIFVVQDSDGSEMVGVNENGQFFGNGSGLTILDAGQLVNALPAISGAALTGLGPKILSSGIGTLGGSASATISDANVGISGSPTRSILITAAVWSMSPNPAGNLFVTNIIDATSFDVFSTNGMDVGVNFFWQILEKNP